MYITRKQSIAIALSLIGLFFGAAFLISDRTEFSEPSVSVTKDEGVKFSLKKFHRSEVKEGVKKWDLDAEKADFLPGTNTTKIYDATLLLYRNGGDPVQVNADTAIYKQDEGDLEASGNVKIVGDRMTITGDQLVADIESEEMVLTENVVTHIAPAAREESE